MKIFVEDYAYPIEYIQEVPNTPYIKLDRNEQSFRLRYVGYYKDASNYLYLFMPKVFEQNTCLFEDIPVEKFITDNAYDVLAQYGKGKTSFNFLNELSVLLYKTLEQAMKRKSNQKILPEIISTIGKDDVAFLSIITSLIRLHKKHGTLYFKKKQLVHKTTDKINWKKTFKKQPIITQNNVMYTDFYSTKETRHQEDLLLTVFYTLLHRFKKEYHFTINLPDGLPRLSDRMFQRNEHKLLKELKKMKTVRFDDLSKQILQLLILYLEQTALARDGKAREEVFVTNSFHLVFEKMMDDLISDPEDARLFKAQRDGKIIDHVFHDKAPFSTDHTLYVGDSKYYKRFEDVQGSSLYKQYTYAKNIIQQYMDDNKKEKMRYYKERTIRLFDETMFAYQIIPNFFILPSVDARNPITFLHNHQVESAHYNNQVYDRDSHTLLYFQIDLCYLMRTYIHTKGRSSEITQFITQNIHDFYQKRYLVYHLTNDFLIDKLKAHHYAFQGKVFHAPFLMMDRRFPKENEQIKSLLYDLEITYTEAFTCQN